VKLFFAGSALRLRRPRAEPGAVLGLLVACSKVPNPYYVDELGDEASGTASESDTSDSGDSSSTDSTTDESETESDSTNTTDTSDTLDDESSEDTDCPPSESGCPCLQGTQCFPGLTCIEGICFAPEDCAPDNPNVLVQSTQAMQSTTTTCTVTPTVMGSALTLSIGGCDDGSTNFSIGLDPLPNGFPALPDASAVVRVHFEQETAFVRVDASDYDLWLVDGGLLVSGNASVSDYPGEVVAVVGDCPGEPKFCEGEVGELQRRGVQVVGQPFFDGNAGLADPSLAVWVDRAVVDCMLPAYRFAIVDWP
jgi:hypothetical protein